MHIYTALHTNQDCRECRNTEISYQYNFCLQNETCPKSKKRYYLCKVPSEFKEAFALLGCYAAYVGSCHTTPHNIPESKTLNYIAEAQNLTQFIDSELLITLLNQPQMMHYQADLLTLYLQGRSHSVE
jgi:hypothetical protein